MEALPLLLFLPSFATLPTQAPPFFLFTKFNGRLPETLLHHRLPQLAPRSTILPLSPPAEQRRIIQTQLKRAFILLADLLLRRRRHGRRMLTVPLFGRRGLAGLRGRTAAVIPAVEVGGPHLLLDGADIGARAALGFRQLGGRGVVVRGQLVRHVVVFVVLVLVERVQPVEPRGAAVALREVLAPLAFLLGAVDRVRDVEDLAQVDGARGAEVGATAAAAGGFEEIGPGGRGGEVVVREAVFLLAGVDIGGNSILKCGCVGLFLRLADPWVVEELLDRVALFWINGEEVRDEILGRFGDVIPPR